MAQLPPEIWAHVLSNMHPTGNDLFSLTLVSKLLKSEAERVIFHTVILPSFGTLGTSAMLERIHAPGPIASYIHRLELRHGIEPITWGVSYERIISGIQHMSNLREMQFNEIQDPPSGFLGQLAENVTFRLQVLDTSVSFSGLERFLRLQTSLQTLKWTTGERYTASMDMAPPFSRRELPSLRTLAVEYSENVSAFLPQCSVSRLQIANLDLNTKMEVMQSVVSLQINVWAIVTSHSPIESLARVFPNVLFLDLIWSHDLVSCFRTLNPQALFRLMCVMKTSQNSLHRRISKLSVLF